MSFRKIDFSKIDWELSSPGIKSKSVEQDGKRIRLLELQKGLEHPDWCLTGHIGLVVEGKLKIRFCDTSLILSAGDSLFISAGESEKHIPIPLTRKVILFLVEDIT